MGEKIRFAVVGLGNIAQTAVLPAFEHARESCELVALISSDATKLVEVGKEYEIEHKGSYDDLERVLQQANVDAAYIAVPNRQHRALTERCAHAGVHVLCEKPLGTSEEECEAMIAACEDNDVKLMVAYRLHFDSANLHAIAVVESGEIGDVRVFASAFGQQAREGDIRTRGDVGGGALLDLGVYCVNAARYILRAEPLEVFAFSCPGHDDRFRGVDETTSAILRFPNDVFAQFSVSQGSADIDAYRVLGTRGDLLLEPAYTYFGEIAHHLTVDGKTTTRTFPKSDQFAPELLHFAKCIQEDAEPEPSGEEGLADARVLDAIAESVRSGKPVILAPFTRARRPSMELQAMIPPVHKPRLVHAPPPTK